MNLLLNFSFDETGFYLI